MGCGAGADPGAALWQEKLEKAGRRAVKRREAARVRAEELCDALVRAEDLRPAGVTRVLAFLFGTLTHLLGLVVLVGSVILLTQAGSNPFGWLIGFIGIGVSWVVRPRIPRRPKSDSWKSRADFPAFYGLLDRSAAAIGAPVPEAVRFDRGFNASTARYGLRHRPVLTVGMPLWQLLDGPGRLALLGHELGHQVNGDTTRGVLVGSANRSLAKWRTVFKPDVMTGQRRVQRIDKYGRVMSDSMEPVPLLTVIGSVLTSALMLPIYIAALLLQRLLGWLNVHVALRAEFLADDLGSRLGSTEAAVNLMQVLSLDDSVFHYIARAKAARGSGKREKPSAGEGLELWRGLCSYIASMPEHELLRHERVSESRGTAADTVHPANHLRRRLLAERPRHDAALHVTDEEWAAIDRELIGYTAVAGMKLLR
jgi:Zn-dependent protease with chaperone function